MLSPHFLSFQGMITGIWDTALLERQLSGRVGEVGGGWGGGGGGKERFHYMRIPFPITIIIIIAVQKYSRTM